MKARGCAILLAILICCMAPNVVLAGQGLPHYKNALNQIKILVCTQCHNRAQDILGVAGFNNTCNTCHKRGNPLGGTKPFDAQDAANPFGTITTVRTGPLYQTSHAWSGRDVNPAAGAQAPADQNMQNGNINGYVLCARCHDVHGAAVNYNPATTTDLPPFLLRVPNDNDAMCRECHKIRDTTSHLSGSHPININYTSSTSKVKLKPAEYYQTPVNANPANPTSAMKLIDGKVLCSTCHGVHYTDSNSGTVDGSATFSTLSTSKGYLLRTDARGRTADAINICTNCHAGKGAHNAKNQNIQCNDCHSAHVEYDPAYIDQPMAERNVNKFLVRRFMNVSTQFGAVRNERTFFRYTGTTSKEYYLGTAGNKGVCQGCHYETATFAKRHYIGGLAANGLKSGYEAAKCATCHNHQSNFSVSGAPLDSVPPTIVPAIIGTLVNGWYSGKVTIVLTATDDDSGVKSVSYAYDGGPETVVPGAATSFDLISDGSHNIAYGAVDNADNPATGSIAIPIDSTPPTFTQIVLPAPNANGWYNGNVTVQFTASDALSGIASITPDTVVSGEGSGQAVTGTAVDVAGNSSSYTVTGINVDKTAPTITISFPSAPLATTPLPTYQLGLANPTSTASDTLSGIAAQSSNLTGGDALGLGIFTYTAVAVDNAGNAATASVTYEVKATPQGTSTLIDALVAIGTLPAQTSGTLLDTLAKALDGYSSNLNLGENMMNTFQNQVNAALNSGKISASTANLLLSAANSIISNQGN